jgi:transcriptional regulator PpsR
VTDADIARPDITLTVGPDGVIRSALAHAGLSEEKLEAWRGRPWDETVEVSGRAEFMQIIQTAVRRGASSIFKVDQVFPSGRQLSIEYTTVSLGEKAGFVAIGKNLQTIADLQARLLRAQEAREQDYWKIREVETRYRLLFDASNEAVVLVRVADMRVAEANLAATKTLGLLSGAEFYLDLSSRDRKSLDSMLEKVRELGRSPGIVLRLGPTQDSWSLRASLMNTELGSFYLFQIASIGGAAPIAPTKDAFSADDIIRRLPDGFAIIDRQGIICKINNTFLDLLQIGAEQAVVGQNLRRWLSSPGTDVSALLGLLRKYDKVRSMAAVLSGELGANVEVEISAVGDKDANPEFFGLLVRDVTRRLNADRPGEMSTIGENSGEAVQGDHALGELVRLSTESIERRTISEALEICDGNRTLAAKRLGISRQSLHTKLNKYGVGAS